VAEGEELSALKARAFEHEWVFAQIAQMGFCLADLREEGGPRTSTVPDCV
jgi:hypothetical protein